MLVSQSINWIAVLGSLFCMFNGSAVLANGSRSQVVLDGSWQFVMDPEDQGLEAQWFRKPDRYKESIQVPGIWQTQGFGQPRGQIRNDYQGAVWYGRWIDIPVDWSGKKIKIIFGGVLRTAKVFLGGNPVGNHDGMLTPFEFEIGDVVQSGQKYWLAVRVDNRLRSGRKSPFKKSLSDRDFQWDYSSPLGVFNQLGNWGGLYRGVTLEARESIWIDEVRVTSDLKTSKVHFELNVKSEREPVRSDVVLKINLIDAEGSRVNQVVQRIRFDEGQVQQTIRCPITVPDLQVWSPERPYLYSGQVVLNTRKGTLDQQIVSLGCRAFTTVGNQLQLNHEPYYLRGYSIGRGDPIVGMFPVNKEYYLQQFQLAKRFGFNLVRYHSSTPPMEAFEAADEIGMLLHVELPVMFSGWLLPNRHWLNEEIKRIAVNYRNHASFFIFAFGNEFNIDRDFRSLDQRAQFLDTMDVFYHLAKSFLPDVFVMSNAGYPVFPSDLVASYKGISSADVPTLKHESGGYRDSLPNIDLVERFSGVLKADRLAYRRAWIEQQGLQSIYPMLRRHSERLQQSVRKWHFEKIRSMTGLSGYEYWLLIDSPADHYADSWEDGLLDYFGTQKDFSIEEMREINGPSVLLISRTVDDRSFWADTGITMDLRLSHFDSQPIHGGCLKWQLSAGDEVLFQQQKEGLSVDPGKLQTLGQIRIPPLSVSRPSMVTLEAVLSNGNKRIKNKWAFWMFPRDLLSEESLQVVSRGIRSQFLQDAFSFIDPVTKIPPATKLVVASQLDWSVFDFLRKGGRVLLLAGENQFDEEVSVSYFPRSGESFGTYIAPDHPAMTRYPHQSYCDLHFFSMIEGGAALDLSDNTALWRVSVGPGFKESTVPFSKRITPIVWALRNSGGGSAGGYSKHVWLFETRVGKGRLIFSMLRLADQLDEARPEIVFMFDTLLRYGLSEQFVPKGTVSEEEISGLLTPYLR